MTALIPPRSCFRITDLVETGLMERWRRMYYPRDECSVAGRARAEPASLTESQGAFVLLAACVALAALLLLAEIVTSHALASYRDSKFSRHSRRSMFYL